MFMHCLQTWVKSTNVTSKSTRPALDELGGSGIEVETPVETLLGQLMVDVSPRTMVASPASSPEKERIGRDSK